MPDRRVSLCLAAALVASGCWAAHGRDRPVPGRDGGPIPPPADAGSVLPPADAGPVDACAPETPTALCARVTGAPTDVALAFWAHTGCACGGTLRCDVTVVAAAEGDRPGALRATIERCGAADCLACTGPTRVDCEVPPSAPAGRYEVTAGLDRFQLFLGSHGSSEPNGVVCQTPGSRGGGLCDFPGEVDRPGWTRLCFPSTAPAGVPVDVRVEGDCVSCAFEPGVCSGLAIVGRAGRAVSVEPTLRNCDEGRPTWDCDGDCAPLTRPCTLPAMEPGTHAVQMHGERVGELVVGAGAPGPMRCVELP